MVSCHSCHINDISTSRIKKVLGILKSHQLPVEKVTKGRLFSQGRQVVTMQYYYIVKLYCKSYWVCTLTDIIGYLFSLYYCCFTCLKLARPKVQLKVYSNYVNTEWVIPEKFLGLILYPLEIPDKTRLHPQRLHITVLHPSEILSPQTKTPGNSK